MNNTKTYTLKKEIRTPNTYILAGTQFSQSIVDGAYISSNGRSTYSPSFVENNSEWFLLKEEDKKQFEWTDELVEQFSMVNHLQSIKSFKESVYNLLNEKPVNDKWYHPMTGSGFFNKNPLTKERLQEIFEVKSDSTQDTLTPQNWKKEVPSQQKEFTEPRGNNFGFNKNYEILTQTYNMDTLKVVIYSVRRLSDNTIWTVGDMVNIVGGILGWQIVSLTESCGVVYADLKLYGNKFSSKQVVLQDLKKYK